MNATATPNLSLTHKYTRKNIPSPLYSHHLHVRNGDVEVLGEVGVPHEADVGQEEAAEVALVRGEVPHALDLPSRHKHDNSAEAFAR